MQAHSHHALVTQQMTMGFVGVQSLLAVSRCIVAGPENSAGASIRDRASSVLSLLGVSAALLVNAAWVVMIGYGIFRLF